MANSRTRFYLKDWQFKANGKSAQDNVASWMPALPPPSTCHQDLLARGLIPDPFLAKQEEDVQWVGEQQWHYRTTFKMPDVTTNRPRLATHLIFEGLDTYATVWLNGKQIHDADNMFLTHRIDISDSCLSQNEPNVLDIYFDNAEARGDKEVEAHPEYSWSSFNSGDSRLAVRKAQYHHGWDWGPKLMTCGIWRPVYIETSESRIQDISIATTISQDYSKATLQVTLETQGAADKVLLIAERSGVIVASQTVKIASVQPTTASLRIAQPELWWPHTFGSQPLYHVTVTLLKDGHAHDKIIKRIGIRKVELVRQPFADGEGSSFFFRINDTRVFAGGSNWIPGDSFLPRITSAKYRRWVELAKASNQVMIRVWGGGIYEDESFYNACDEMGVLVWQDFMFACGMFPTYDSFLENTRLELEDNLRKLRHHPSIVLWCGNNEDYVIPLISNIEYDHNDKDPQSILKSDFPARYIYEHLMPEICSRLVPDIPYWPGSPFGGEMINSTEEGDVHQWHVWHLERYPYQDFPKLAGRFVSEFGMQGMPCLRTCKDFFPAGDTLEDGRDYSEDEYVQFHNKCADGSETLHGYCESNIPLDTKNLQRYIHATQLIQSETVATAYRSWRRLWKGEGKEFCGGALIWQLNDCWPVTSWALVDSHFRPKMAYWAMKRENSPISAGVQRTTTEDGVARVEVWAVNTSLQGITADVRMRAWKVQGGPPVLDQYLQRGLSLLGNQSTEITSLDLATLNLRSNDNFKDIVLAVDIVLANVDNVNCSTTSQISQSISFHEPLKEVLFQQPALFDVKILEEGERASLMMKSPVALKGVLVEVNHVDSRADEVTWDDNGFDLLPGQVVNIGVQGLKRGEEHRISVTWLGGQWKGLSAVPAKALL